jgi:hypothetical protein
MILILSLTPRPSLKKLRIEKWFAFSIPKTTFFVWIPKASANMTTRVHRQKQSYWRWLGFDIQKPSYKWHPQARCILVWLKSSYTRRSVSTPLHFKFHTLYHLSLTCKHLHSLTLTIHILHFTFYILYFIFYILHFTFYILNFTFYILLFTFYILHSAFYILHSIFYILYSPSYIFTLYILHLYIFTLHSTLYNSTPSHFSYEAWP